MSKNRLLKACAAFFGTPGITTSINRNFAIIIIDSYNSLPIEKALTFHKVIILIKSVVNENTNNYFYNMFFEKRFV